LLTEGTTELCAAIRRENYKERVQLLVRDWWLAADRSPEDARRVLECKIWGGEPCRVVASEVWVALWRRAGFINIGQQPRPTVPTRVFRAAEPAVVRALSWTPDRGYAEGWREVAKASGVEASGVAARNLLAGTVREREVVSSSGATVHTWSALASPEAVLAVLEHPGGVEWVCDPELLTDVEQLEPDPEAARQFIQECERNADRFPRMAQDAEGRFYWRRADGYHLIVDMPGFIRHAKAHGISIDLDGAPTRPQATTVRSARSCDLCDAKPITERRYEDDVCWVADCVICKVPMVVWRQHHKTPPTQVRRYMHERLAAVTPFAHYVDDRMRKIPDHYHAHARAKPGPLVARPWREQVASDGRPAVYLDYDGVFRAGYHGTGPHIARCLTDAIATLDADLYWLTVRGESVHKHADFGIEATVVATPTDWPESTWLADNGSWWKLQVMQQRAADGRPFVWIDDHLHRVRAAWDWSASLIDLSRWHLFVAPSSSAGLEDRQVNRVVDYVAMCNAALRHASQLARSGRS
jgi:hypothetical protein